jgi:hypothetical protein
VSPNPGKSLVSSGHLIQLVSICKYQNKSQISKLRYDRRCVRHLPAAHDSNCHFRVRWDSRTYFAVSDSRLPQPGAPRPRIYIPQKQSGPVLLPGNRFTFRHLLRLTGLLERYSTRLHTGSLTQNQKSKSHYD